jgi:hypothetical protein
MIIAFISSEAWFPIIIIGSIIVIPFISIVSVVFYALLSLYRNKKHKPKISFLYLRILFVTILLTFILGYGYMYYQNNVIVSRTCKLDGFKAGKDGYCIRN